MPSGAYHTRFNEASNRGQPVPDRNRKYISSIPLLPIRHTTKAKGPAPELPCDRDMSILAWHQEVARYYEEKARDKTKKAPVPEFNGDIIDEALIYFKANIMFRTFDMRGFADRLFVYITLYINACLVKCAHKSKGEAEKILYAYAIENFAIPGDGTFALGGLCPAPTNAGDREMIRAYLQQIRQETYPRLLELIYAHDDRQPDKWWMCFAKRKFLNKTL